MKKSWIISLVLIIISCAFVFSACSSHGGGSGGGESSGSGSGSGSGGGAGSEEGSGTQTYYAYFLVDNNVFHTASTNGRGYVTFPDDPQKDGYGFDGWWVGSEQKTMLYNQSEDISLTAKFKPIFTLTGGKITGLTDYGKTLSVISIPSKIDGVTITSISSLSSTNLQSLHLTSSIKEIAKDAFSNCGLLSEIYVENAKDWFNSLKPYTTLTPPYIHLGLTDGYDLYVDDVKLESLTITSDYNFQYDGMIGECKSLKKLIIDDSVDTLAMRSLSSSYVKDIYISDLKKWCENVFGNAVVYTEYNLWVNDKKLTYVNDTKIMKYDFTGCQSLQTVVVADGTKSEDICFGNCSNLISVILPTSVTVISQDDQFYDCDKLEYIFCYGSKITNNGIDEDKIYFYSMSKPDSKNCWHFVDGIPTIWA